MKVPDVRLKYKPSLLTILILIITIATLYLGHYCLGHFLERQEWDDYDIEKSPREVTSLTQGEEWTKAEEIFDDRMQLLQEFLPSDMLSENVEILSIKYEADKMFSETKHNLEYILSNGYRVFTNAEFLIKSFYYLTPSTDSNICAQEINEDDALLILHSISNKLQQDKRLSITERMRLTYKNEWALLRTYSYDGVEIWRKPSKICISAFTGKLTSILHRSPLLVPEILQPRKSDKEAVAIAYATFASPFQIWIHSASPMLTKRLLAQPVSRVYLGEEEEIYNSLQFLNCIPMHEVPERKPRVCWNVLFKHPENSNEARRIFVDTQTGEAVAGWDVASSDPIL